MGIPRDAGAGAVRLSLGRSTTRDQLESLIARLADIAPAPRAGRRQMRP
jgi:cysteine sulfinate desulfinase/cysteine desulfurase-like protein